MIYSEIRHIDISNYCISPVKIGGFVCSVPNQPHQVIAFKDAERDSVVIGFSQHEFMLQVVGCKISIVTDADIYVKLNKHWKLPYGQDLFLTKRGKLTFRRSPHRVAITVSSQESDGWVKIRVKL